MFCGWATRSTDDSARIQLQPHHSQPHVELLTTPTCDPTSGATPFQPSSSRFDTIPTHKPALSSRHSAPLCKHGSSTSTPTSPKTATHCPGLCSHRAYTKLQTSTNTLPRSPTPGTNNPLPAQPSNAVLQPPPSRISAPQTPIPMLPSKLPPPASALSPWTKSSATHPKSRLARPARIPSPTSTVPVIHPSRHHPAPAPSTLVVRSTNPASSPFAPQKSPRNSFSCLKRPRSHANRAGTTSTKKTKARCVTTRKLSPLKKRMSSRPCHRRRATLNDYPRRGERRSLQGLRRIVRPMGIAWRRRVSF